MKISDDPHNIYIFILFTRNKRENIMSLAAQSVFKKSSSFVGDLMSENHYRKDDKQRTIRLLIQKLCQKTSEIEPQKFQKWRNKDIKLKKKEESSYQKVHKLLEDLNNKLVQCKVNNLWKRMRLKQYSQKLVRLMEIFLKFKYRKEADKLLKDGKDHEKLKIVAEYEKIKKLSKDEVKERQYLINQLFSPEYTGDFNNRQCLGCINGVIDSKYGQTYYSTQSQPPCKVFGEPQFDLKKYDKRQLKIMVCHLLNNVGGYVWIGVRRYKNLLEPVGINQVTKVQQDKFITEINKFCPNTTVTFIPMMQYKSQVVAQKYEENNGKQVIKCVPIEGKCIIRIRVIPSMLYNSNKQQCYILVKSQNHEKIISFSHLNVQLLRNFYEKTQLLYLYTDENCKIQNNNFSFYDYMHNKYQEGNEIDCRLQKCKNNWKHKQAQMCNFIQEELKNKTKKQAKKQAKEYRFQSMLTASVAVQKQFHKHLIQNKLGQMHFDRVSRKWIYQTSENTDVSWLVSHNLAHYEMQEIISLIIKEGQIVGTKPTLKKLNKIRLNEQHYKEYQKEYEIKLKNYNFEQLWHSIQPRNKSKINKVESKDYERTLTFNNCSAVACAYLFFKSKQIPVDLVD